jgi:hypothetical protein
MVRRPGRRTSRKIQLKEPDPALRGHAEMFASSVVQSRSKVDIAHWYITVLGLNVNFDAPISAVRNGPNANFVLAMECNHYPPFTADRLNLQKSDVSTASTVGQFYQDILKRYIKNHWILT